MVTVGAASIDITHEVGNFIQAAGHVKRASQIRDRCEANAMLLSDGRSAVLLVSLDLVGLEMDQAWRMREAAGRGAGIDPHRVLVAGTHMHSGPSLIQTHPDKSRDMRYLDRLETNLEDLGRRAASASQPARIGWGLGSQRIGYNRRCCWADGSHTMHGDTTRVDFRGLEGPDDPSHLTIFAVDADDRPIAVLYNNTTHPTTFYGADFYSADFPGMARGFLREALGESVAVLYFNGAQGDISIEDQLTRQNVQTGRELSMVRTAHQVTGETLRLFTEVAFNEHVDLGSVTEDIELPIALPRPERIAWAESLLAERTDSSTRMGMDFILAYGIKSLQDQFSGQKEQAVPLQAIRIGEVLLCAVPFELYCQFGLDIKRRSPAPLSGIVGIANGSEGYLSTPYATMGGGYSGEPIRWTRFAPDAGFSLVDRCVELLYRAWCPTTEE